MFDTLFWKRGGSYDRVRFLPFLSTDTRLFFYTIHCFENTVSRKRSKVVLSACDCETGLWNTLIIPKSYDQSTLGFHVTLRWPCWLTEQQRKNSFGNLTLLLSKTWATFCHFFVNEHGRLITWVKTKNSTHFKNSFHLIWTHLDTPVNPLIPKWQGFLSEYEKNKPVWHHWAQNARLCIVSAAPGWYKILKTEWKRRRYRLLRIHSTKTRFFFKPSAFFKPLWPVSEAKSCKKKKRRKFHVVL